jgi:peptidoglycan/LPS O-acetylase OafA/YrhL
MGTATFIFFEKFFFPSFNWVLWSLGLEIWFSIVFPYLVFLLGKIGVRKFLVYVFGLSLFVRILGIVFNPTPENLGLNYIKDSFLGRLDDFALGMILAHAFIRERRFDRAYVNISGFWLGLVCVFAVCILWDNVVLEILPDIVIPSLNILLNFGFFMLVSSLLSKERGVLKKIFINPFLQVPGLMAYSLYVWHGIILAKILPFSLAKIDAPLFLLYLAETVVLIILIATLSYRYIEFGKAQDWRTLFRASP